MTGVLVVGDVMVDVIVRPSGPLAHGTDRAATITSRPGGSAANIACWLAACGVPVALAARVGAADHAARCAELAAFGVTARLAADPARPTGTVVALIDADGERSFYTDRAANAGLCAADLPVWLLDGVLLLHVSGHALIGSPDAARGLMAEATARGIPVTADAASAGWLAGDPLFVDRVAGCAALFANAAEAALLWPDGDPTLAGGVVVVTLGADGAIAYRGPDVARVAGAPQRAVDTVGAGDAFVAGYLASILTGADLATSVTEASRLAASAVLMGGGRPSDFRHRRVLRQ